MSKHAPWTDEQSIQWAYDAAERDFRRFHGIDEEFEGWENDDFERGFLAGLAKAAEQIEKCETITHGLEDGEFSFGDTHEAKLVGVREVNHDRP